MTFTKTRGSAQQAFARAVKGNYGWRCALTGILTPQFLVASHIVPWADDPTIRLDPSNGLCLSTLVDRAFDIGVLSIGTDLVVSIRSLKDDHALAGYLEPLHGTRVTVPVVGAPNLDYLERRLAAMARERLAYPWSSALAFKPYACPGTHRVTGHDGLAADRDDLRALVPPQGAGPGVVVVVVTFRS